MVWYCIYTHQRDSVVSLSQENMVKFKQSLEIGPHSAVPSGHGSRSWKRIKR